MTRVLVRIAIAIGLAGGVAAAQPAIDDAPAQREPGPRATEGVDRRAFYVGAGAVVFIALMMWNRRHRAALDRKSEDETRRIRAAARARREQPADDSGADSAGVDDGDPDADDLAAAARARSTDQEPS